MLVDVREAVQRKRLGNSYISPSNVRLIVLNNFIFKSLWKNISLITEYIRNMNFSMQEIIWQDPIVDTEDIWYLCRKHLLKIIWSYFPFLTHFSAECFFWDPKVFQSSDAWGKWYWADFHLSYKGWFLISLKTIIWPHHV